jgi:vacuolar-type H+-ATPase subunit I/STV1
MECLAYPCVIQEAHNVVINAIPHQDFREEVAARDHDLVKLKSQIKSLNKQMKSVVRNVKDREHQVVQLKGTVKKVKADVKEVEKDFASYRETTSSLVNRVAALQTILSKCEDYGFIEIDRDALGKVDSTSKFLQFTINPITADGKPISQDEAQKYMNKLEGEKTKLKGICLKIVRDNDEGLGNIVDRLRKENKELLLEKDMWEKDAVGFRKHSNMLLDLIKTADTPEKIKMLKEMDNRVEE